MIIDQKIQENQLCAHCGEQCDDLAITAQNNNFCCTGCKTVFEILHDNGLDAYYQLESMPGNSLKEERSSWKFQYLDDSNVQHEILDFKSENLAKVNLYCVELSYTVICYYQEAYPHSMNPQILYSEK